MPEYDINDEGQTLGIELSGDELRILTLYRKMMHRDYQQLAKSHLWMQENLSEEQSSLFDEALVIAHDTDSKDYHIGFIDFDNREKAMSEITLSSIEDYASVEELWKKISVERQAGMKKENRVHGFFNRLSERITRSEKIHARAREIIAEHDEISKQEEAALKRIEVLLSKAP